MLSVSIVTFKVDEEEFKVVLNSLNKAIESLNQWSACQVQITIINNGNQENFLKELISTFKSKSSKYELISGQGNIGYGRANNLAIRKLKSEYHLILNPDVIMEEESLTIGLKYLESLDKSSAIKVCAISPRAINEHGEFQYLCKRFPSVLNFLLRGFAPQKIKQLFRKRLNIYELRDKIKPELKQVVNDVPLISGCFMLCNTKILQKVGGFNEEFFLHFEDLALSLELRKFGILSYVPEMRIKHFGGNSAKNGFKHVLIFIKSGIKFFNMYGWKF